MCESVQALNEKTNGRREDWSLKTGSMEDNEEVPLINVSFSYNF